jgi:hypothetical protein
MAIDTTVGGANANSWASVAEFKVYRDVRLPASAVVTAATDALIEAALQVACRSINENFDWTGAAVDNVQALAWPRSGMLSRNGFAIATTVNPKELKDAQCEMAFQIIAGADLVADNAAAAQGVALVQAGSVKVAFQHQLANSYETADIILRRLTNEFAYLSTAMPGEVRRMLVNSWYNQPTIFPPVMFGAM